MASPAELIDDVVGDICVRLPPDEPEHLFRASLVCKPWLRLLTDPDFLRRYRASHRTPPLLGYLKRLGFLHRHPDTGLIPTTSVTFAPFPHSSEALDCHHGRVLLRVADTLTVSEDKYWHLVVWDPVTGRQERLPDLWSVLREPSNLTIENIVTGERKRLPDAGCVQRCEQGNYSAAVCCAVTGCDHLDCHGGPFRVVFIVGGHRGQVKACVYSSETGAWSTRVTYVQRAHDYLSFPPRRGAIMGDEICFTSLEAHVIVKYDMRENRLSMIDWPPVQDECNCDLSIMEMEDGSLGLAYIRRSSFSLCVWSRKLNNSEAAAEWVLCKVLDLREMIPSANYDHGRAYVAGAAEGLGVIFVCTRAGLFTVELNSGKVKKMGEFGVYGTIIPFMSFYTPDFVDDDVSRWRTIERQRVMIAQQKQLTMRIFMSIGASPFAPPPFGPPPPQLDQAPPQPNQGQSSSSPCDEEPQAPPAPPLP